MEGPMLWFANRGTGVVLLVLLTFTTLIGVLSTHGDAGRRVPRFVTQALHRNLSLISVVLLVAHVVTAVVDEYVDIRWWQAVVPVGATYQPLWLGLGTLSLDLMAAVVATSLVRHRLPHRPWRVIHWSAYACWGMALAHGAGMGTDAGTPWGLWTTIVCASAVTLALAVRLAGLGRKARGPARPVSADAGHGRMGAVR